MIQKNFVMSAKNYENWLTVHMNYKKTTATIQYWY